MWCALIKVLRSLVCVNTSLLLILLPGVLCQPIVILQKLSEGLFGSWHLIQYLPTQPIYLLILRRQCCLLLPGVLCHQIVIAETAANRLQHYQTLLLLPQIVWSVFASLWIWENISIFLLLFSLNKSIKRFRLLQTIFIGRTISD